MQEWVAKYRPKVLDDMVMDEKVRDMLRSYLADETIMNCTLVGHPGIGKTTLAEIIIAMLPECTEMYINASEENGVDVIRNKIREFTEAVAIGGGMKVVILDEADRLTIDAQRILRGTIEKCISDTRFILTCNHIGKMEKAVLSRCTPITLTFSQVDVLKRLVHILKAEGVSFTKDDMRIVAEDIMKCHFPDIRTMVKHLEMCSKTGTFQYSELKGDAEADEIINFLVENINTHRTCREHWIKNEGAFHRDYLMLSTRLYNFMYDIGSPDEVMVLLGDEIHDMNQVLDQEIHFDKMIRKLRIALSK